MTQEGLELRLSILKVTRGCAVLTNSSPLAQKAKESLKSSSVKVKLNKRFFLILNGRPLFCPFEPIKPGYLVASSTASWKFFISPCDLCVYRSIPALKFLLKAVSNFSNLRLKKYVQHNPLFNRAVRENLDGQMWECHCFTWTIGHMTSFKDSWEWDWLKGSFNSLSRLSVKMQIALT